MVAVNFYRYIVAIGRGGVGKKGVIQGTDQCKVHLLPMFLNDIPQQCLPSYVLVQCDLVICLLIFSLNLD